MTVTRRGQPIRSLDEWLALAGPKRDYHWQDGRSAMEAARAWLGATSPALPPEVAAALSAHAAFGSVLEWSAEPEVRLSFDELRGEPRNTDLLVRARDSHGEFLVAVEAKADESFGETVAQAMDAACKRLADNARSGGLQRLRRLCTALFGRTLEEDPTLGTLRYQLLTATAGAIAVSIRQGRPRVVLLIHEFRTEKTIDSRHDENSADLNTFVTRLTRGETTRVGSGELHGPLTIPGGELFGSLPPFFVGKATHNLRSACA